MNLRGNSNFYVFLQNGKVVKKTKYATDSERLNKQMVKQDQFNKIINNQYFKAADIMDSSFVEDQFCFYMNYYNHLAFYDFFDIKATSKFFLFSFYEKFDSLHSSYIKKCEYKKIPINDIQVKFYSVLDNILDRCDIPKGIDILFDNQFNSLLQLINPLQKIPIGICHGDLTFSNCLFTKDKIILIDFLDSFIETPLQDLVKIRQDTKYKWSFLMAKKCNKVKLTMQLDYLDLLFEKRIEELYGKSIYNLFQFLNLLRIVPYSKNKDVTDFLIYNIRGIK